MVQTRFDTLYVCEIKFSREPIRSGIIDEMELKLSRLKKPKNFSIRPVLIHVNGVSDSVIESNYFSQIIDFGKLLRPPQ
jgi:hypothetical protein